MASKNNGNLKNRIPDYSNTLKRMQKEFENIGKSIQALTNKVDAEKRRASRLEDNNKVKGIKQKEEETKKGRIRQWFTKGENIVSIISLLLTIAGTIASILLAFMANNLTVKGLPLSYSYVETSPYTETPGSGYFLGELLNTPYINKSRVTLDFSMQIESGQIYAIYLVYKMNGDYRFEILNQNNILKAGDTFNVTKTIWPDMEEIGYSSKEEVESEKYGKSLMYIVVQDMNEQYKIDIMEIAGLLSVFLNEDSASSVEESIQTGKPITATFHAGDGEFSYRFLQHNSLIQLENSDGIEWVTLGHRDEYLEEESMIDKKVVQQEIAEISELFDSYRF